MPVIEAMAAGAPVVASNTSSIPEIAGGAALLCDKDDVNSHTTAICSIVESPALRARLCGQSREQARQFTWVNSAKQLNDLFFSVLNS